MARSGQDHSPQLVLGIETSCDDTGVAVVDGARRIRAEKVISQNALHAAYGGIVPEIAARAHVTRLDALIAEVMAEAGLGWADLDAFAVTSGPGLIGGLVVGTVTARTLASVFAKPVIGINHLEAHALTARLTDDLPFPYLLLLVSGGHCQLLSVEGLGDYRRLGTTIDDALGEAFDKVAKLFDLGFPGGPAVERAARNGDASRFDFPRPLAGKPGCHFSFSGLKTAVRREIERIGPANIDDQTIADLCASFQAAAFDTVIERTGRAIRQFHTQHPQACHLVVAGGVAANQALARVLKTLAERHGMTLVVPPARLCTDNGVMIAWAGLERLRAGLIDATHLQARARWPLDPDAEPLIGSGARAKA